MSRDMRETENSDRESGEPTSEPSGPVWSAKGGVQRIDFDACATVSLSQAAEVLGVHRSTAWELYKRGEFPVPVLHIGNRLRVTKLHLERFLLTGECR